jgi:ATP-binding cassette subfamily B protein
VVKSFAQEDREIDSFDEKNLEEYDARTTAVTARSRFIPSLTFLTSLGVLAVWLIGGGWVLGGVLTVGWLIAYISYMNMFYNPVRQLLNLAEVFQESATGAERIFNVMDTPSDVTDHEQACDVSAVRGQIDIRNVSFTYDEGEYVLKDITLAIAPGEMIGLVGQTGSGKSTLVSLVARFYDPTKGCICLDGVDLRDMRMKALRSNIGMVLQDPFLFAGTIRDNIAYGRPGASEAEIIQAAKAANAHEFIMNLPDAYDTRVGERGVSLSGGEKQRVSIARAVLKDPPILILDEATSAVDTATEAIIQEAMDRLVHGRTTIAIAHRLSTLRNADRLIVLDAGEIIEQGTHDELCDIQANFAKTLPADSMLRLSGRRR